MLFYWGSPPTPLALSCFTFLFPLGLLPPYICLLTSKLCSCIFLPFPLSHIPWLSLACATAAADNLTGASLMTSCHMCLFWSASMCRSANWTCMMTLFCTYTGKASVVSFSAVTPSSPGALSLSCTNFMWLLMASISIPHWYIPL